jgi:hypothetical protein
MRNETSSMQLKLVDYIYVLFCCIAAGPWQFWCFSYGRDNVFVFIGMSMPFALASYAYASLAGTNGVAADRPDWKRILILWAGMPLSLVVFALMNLAELGIMHAVGFGTVDLPFFKFRLLVGEGTACLAWTVCLLLWSRRPGFHMSRNRFFTIFAILFVGVIFAYEISNPINKSFHRDIYLLLTSIVVTAISALILVFLRNRAET